MAQGTAAGAQGWDPALAHCGRPGHHCQDLVPLSSDRWERGPRAQSKETSPRIITTSSGRKAWRWLPSPGHCTAGQSRLDPWRGFPALGVRSALWGQA